MQNSQMQFKEVIVEMSHNCNISCQMCGFGFRYNPVKKKKFMSADNFCKIVDIFANNTSVLRLNGRGESTIHPDFTELLNWTHKKYPLLQLSIFTNASVSNESIINTLISCNVLTFISFDSVRKNILEKIRYGCKYETVIENISRLKNHKTRPFLIATLQKDNIDEIEDIGKFAFENNCSIIFNTIRSDDETTLSSFFNYVNENTGKISNAFDNTYALFEHSGLQCLIPDQIGGIAIHSQCRTTTHGSMMHCPAIDNELCILYDGTVTPCNMFNPYVYGNIFETKLDDIFFGKKRSNLKKLYKQHYYCKNCANLGV